MEVEGTLQGIAWGAILNISMDNELMQSAMIQFGFATRILQALTSVLTPLPTSISTTTPPSQETSKFIIESTIPSSEREKHIVISAVKVWSNVLESDEALKVLFESEGFSILSSLIERMSLLLTCPSLDSEDYDWIIEVMDATSVVLETISEKESAQSQMVHTNILTATMNFIDPPLSQRNQTHWNQVLSMLQSHPL